MLDPIEAAGLLRDDYVGTVVLPADITGSLPALLSAVGIRGGAVYDALVGLAAREAGLPLVTRDGRALATYAALGVRVELIPS